MKQRHINTTLFMVVLLLAMGAAFAVPAPSSEGESFSISWHTVDGGGGVSTGAAYTLAGTIGQPDAGMMSGDTFELTGGYWSMSSGAICTGDTDGSNVVDVVDLTAVILDWGSTEGGPADVNNDGIVDIDDLIEVILSWGPC